MKKFLRLGLSPAFLLLCLILGGASAAGFWSNLLLQLLGSLLIVYAIATRRQTPLSASFVRLACLGATIIGLILVQLIPLPPSIWTHLPGRSSVAQGFIMIGMPLPWLPVSLEARETLGSAAWLIPALAVFLGIAKLGSYKSEWIAWVIVGIALLSVPLGALQILAGADSRWYFYAITNKGQTTGFFANANHLSIFLVASLPFVAALCVSQLKKERRSRHASGLTVVLIGAMVGILAGILVNGSLAGYGLAIPVLLASYFLFRIKKFRGRWWQSAAFVALTAVAVGAIFSSSFENNLVGKGSMTPESRRVSFANTFESAKEFLPVGSGIGSFKRIYAQRENPTTVTRVFMNHAHNDYLELLLETGVAGIILIGLFLLWWATRAVAIWRDPEQGAFARAATIASAAILVHSLVDYPLRTAALSAVFAACSALMSDARPRAARKQASKKSHVRHLSAD